MYGSWTLLRGAHQLLVITLSLYSRTQIYKRGGGGWGVYMQELALKKLCVILLYASEYTRMHLEHLYQNI